MAAFIVHIVNGRWRAGQAEAAIPTLAVRTYSATELRRSAEDKERVRSVRDAQ